MHSANKAADAETVMVTYHPKPGREADLQATLAQAWQIYTSEHLVYTEPHVLVRDNGDDTRFVEIFTWAVSPDHPTDNVKAIWKQERSLCEARDGHTSIEGGPVELVTGR